MCGLAGILMSGGCGGLNEQIVRQMCDSMRARGPDAEHLRWAEKAERRLFCRIDH
jgi:asparagine synthetase B (glutamine-hydrolysing)